MLKSKMLIINYGPKPNKDLIIKASCTTVQKLITSKLVFTLGMKH